jgi:hypothetical protein
MKKSLSIFWLATVAAAIAGCVTSGADWNRRVGTYTYNQAVSELGPPAKQETLADGRVTVEWVTRYNISAASPELDSSFQYHTASPIRTENDYRISKLRLTFTTNSLLTDWSKN